VEIVGAFSSPGADYASDQGEHSKDNQTTKDTNTAGNQGRGNQDDDSNRFETNPASAPNVAGTSCTAVMATWQTAGERQTSLPGLRGGLGADRLDCSCLPKLRKPESTKTKHMGWQRMFYTGQA
jgi:hypothetical protein